VKLKLEIIKETTNLIEEDSVRLTGAGPISGPVMHLDFFLPLNRS